MKYLLKSVFMEALGCPMRLNYCHRSLFVNFCASHPLDGFVRYPSHETKRYLIKVGDAERDLVLHPFPDGFLEWDAKGVLGMAGR